MSFDIDINGTDVVVGSVVLGLIYAAYKLDKRHLELEYSEVNNGIR